MAKVQLNPILGLITGKIGNLVFRRSHNGKLSVFYRSSKTRTKWSSAQKAQREEFSRAVDYAKSAMKDPELLTFYEQMSAEKKGNNRPFDMAVSDYFKREKLLTKQGK